MLISRYKKKGRLCFMIIDISDEKFKKIFSDKRLHLPIRWNNNDFADSLKILFEIYLNQVEKEQSLWDHSRTIKVNSQKIRRVCNLLHITVKHYLNGFPAKAFTTFKTLMSLLEENPLKTYQKSITEQLAINDNDTLNLYRVTCVSENSLYNRKRVFHTPYYLRSKVSTSRYSIAGFPSLYLGTSLELCCEEVHYNPHEQFALASRFQIERNYANNNTDIKVIELAIKPQDFLWDNDTNNYYITNDNIIKKRIRRISSHLLNSHSIRSAYLLWYPLIAACSFIRVNKKDPFAAEYIIPQLMMQWVRSQLEPTKDSNKKLIGIRYFSCASEKSSDMGFNYVFPASGVQTNNSFCPILTKAFILTKPYYIHEYYNTWDCESVLNNDSDLRIVEE